MEFRFRPSADFSASLSNAYINSQPLPSGGFISNDPGLLQNQISAREALQREIEKERIRSEIIASEIVRQRELEEEVRRELALEREIDFQRQAAQRMSSLQLERRVQVEQRFPQLRAGVGERFALMAGEINPTVNEFGMGQVAVLGSSTKPNLAGTKRKATPAAARGGEISLLIVPKKSQKQKKWICALCQVTTTCEKGLDAHLQGRKHKANETALKYKKSTIPKKEAITNEPKPTRIKKQEDKKNQVTVTVETTNQKEVAKNKKFNFWCEKCNVGCFSEKVMNSHRKGKKHRARLLEHEDKMKGKAEDMEEVVTEEAKEKMKGKAEEIKEVTKEVEKGTKEKEEAATESAEAKEVGATVK